MAEVDYQMALLLQYKLEQEHKRKENTDSDHKLALELQQQFQAEAEVERPSNNLVYKAPTVNNNSKCLVDPSWEVIDPTPDIHVLFMAFNHKFFWNTLGSVTVAWSKRMTTCAGVCSYQGRGGMCSITLSEPLLKLRPRKDLVETLLHEMIHAYLFITNNNRDRDGHGPEFHKHMNRINAEAGTNITVYHDFHDEVRLYQQHWWRCDGPCQNWKPYFGMVRRATNRPPGPYDRWFDDHKNKCGGVFVKVKSPEQPSKQSTAKKKQDPPKETNSKNDIRNYLPSTSKTQPNSNPSIPKVTQPKTATLPKNIQTISNNPPNTSQVSNVIPSKTSNIFGFTNLSSSSNNLKKPGSGVRGAVKNAGSSTFVVTKKDSKTENSSSSTAADVKPFSGSGRSLSEGRSSSLGSTGDYSKVREHWLKKFGNNGVKRPISTSGACSSPPKMLKVTPSDDKDKVDCPVCGKKFKTSELNDHLDSCLENASGNDKECVICGEKVAIKQYEKHVLDCTEKHFKDEDEDVFLVDLAKPTPNDNDTNLVDLAKPESEDNETNHVKLKNCPVCKKALPEKEYTPHVEKCILGMCDEFDKKYDLVQSSKTSCLACGKKILKSDLESHLEDCMSMTNVFDTSNVGIEECEDAPEKISEEHKYNCPFCLKLVVENEMQKHLDHCLTNVEKDASDNFKEKSMLVESLYEIDSDVD